MSTLRVDGHLSGIARTGEEQAGDHIVSSCTRPDPVVAALIADLRELGDLHGMLTPVEQAGFAKLAVDERFETVPLPFADGVTPARKL